MTMFCWAEMRLLIGRLQMFNNTRTHPSPQPVRLRIDNMSNKSSLYITSLFFYQIAEPLQDSSTAALTSASPLMIFLCPVN